MDSNIDIQQRFYVLRDDPSDEEFNASDFDRLTDNFGEALCCPVCGGFISMLPWLPPYAGNLELWGQAFGDIIVSGGDALIVSDRFMKAYSNASLTGLSGFNPVKILKVKRHVKGPKIPPPYYYVTVARSQVEVDDAKSEIERDNSWPPCPRCHGGDIERAKRIIIDPTEWKGEDIFIARGLPGTCVVSKKFRDFCVANDIKNATLIPAEQYSIEW